jgi:hypothetical protein
MSAMKFYTQLYHNLCVKGKLNKEHYGPGSGLHAHHIIPRHTGGTDDPHNYTFLTVREHVIAHYLLWKMHRNPNDLRSMHMLGANLSPAFRKITGVFCRDNNIGIHAADSEQRAEWGRLAYEKNIQEQTAFAYWASPEGRKQRASMGGKASLISGNNKEFAYWMSPEGVKKRAQMGAAASAKKPATNGIITKKFHTEEDRLQFLKDNIDWWVGTHWSKRKRVSES